MGRGSDDHRHETLCFPGEDQGRTVLSISWKLSEPPCVLSKDSIRGNGNPLLRDAISPSWTCVPFLFILLKERKLAAQVRGNGGRRQKHRLLNSAFHQRKILDCENPLLKTSIPAIYRAWKIGLKSKAVIAKALKLCTCKVNSQRSLKT